MNCLSILGAAALILTTACTATAAPAPATTTDSSYNLAGTITGLGNGWVYLRHISTNTIDSTRASDGKFRFSGMFALAKEYIKAHPSSYVSALELDAYFSYDPDPVVFTILGVSLDDNKAKWLEAIKKDGLKWIHVSDLKGWQNSVAVQYGIAGVPMNFLVDKEGKSIAKGLRGEDLEKKLAEVVH